MNDHHAHIIATAAQLVGQGAKTLTVAKLAAFMSASDADVLAALATGPDHIKSKFGLAPPTPTTNRAFKVRK